MPRSRIPSAVDRLRTVADNNYADVAKQFEHYPGTLVDFEAAGGIEAEPRDREARNLDRISLRKMVLSSPQTVPQLAVIVNVAGRPKAFPDVLRSLAYQTFVQERPHLVEVVLVQDGSDGVLDESVLDDVRTAMDEFPPKVERQGLRLASDRDSRGRGTARNVGISCVRTQPDVIMFLDDGMILDPNFLVEHMMRHMHIESPIALLGFKENCKFRTFDEYKSWRETRNFDNRKRWQETAQHYPPNFRNDWKWSHKLQLDEATIEEGRFGFDYAGKHYEPGSTINYMQITENFNALDGKSQIGHRALPMFFHTGLTSVTYGSVVDVGGFAAHLDVGLWGFEDSYLGLLLAAKKVKLIPCPSSVAYKVEIEDEEVDITKPQHIEKSRQGFWDLANNSPWSMYNKEKLEQEIEELWNSDLLERVELSRAPEPSRTHTRVTYIEAPPPVSGLFSTSLPTVGSSQYEVEEKFRLFGGRPDDLSIQFTALEHTVATHSFDRDLVRELCATVRAPGARTRSFTIRSLPGAGLSLALAQLVRDLSRDADKTLFWVIDSPNITDHALSKLSKDAAESFYSHISAYSPRVEHAVIILDDVSKASSRLIRNLVDFRQRCKHLADRSAGPRVTFIFGSFGDARTCSEDDTFELKLTERDQERCYERMKSGEPKVLVGDEDGLDAILRAHPEARWYEDDAQAFIDFLLEHGQPTLDANRYWLATTDELDDSQLAIFTKTATAQLIGLHIEEAVVKRLFSPDAGEPLRDVEQVVRKVRGLALIKRDWKGLGLSCPRRARSILERTNRFEYGFLCEAFSKFLRESLAHFQADGHSADRTLDFARHIFQRLSKRALYRFRDDDRIARYLLTIHLDSLAAASHRWNVVEMARWAGTLSGVLEPVDDEDPMDETSLSEAGNFICRLCEDTINESWSEERSLEPAVALSLCRASRLLSQNAPQHASRVKSFCVRLQYRISTEAFLDILNQVLTSDVDPAYRANELVYEFLAFEDKIQGNKNREYCKKMDTWLDKVEKFFNENDIVFDAGSWLRRADYVWIDRHSSVQQRQRAAARRCDYLKEAYNCTRLYPSIQGTWGKKVAQKVKRFRRDYPDLVSQFQNSAV